jgi:hypothetical protein
MCVPSYGRDGLRLSAAAILCRSRRLSAHRCGDFCPRAGLPGTRASGYRPQLLGSPSPSPAKAPRGRVVMPAGRSPVASRDFACEAKPQAPHTGGARPVRPKQKPALFSAPARSGCSTSRTPLEAPLMSRLVGIYAVIGRKSSDAISVELVDISYGGG